MCIIYQPCLYNGNKNLLKKKKQKKTEVEKYNLDYLSCCFLERSWLGQCGGKVTPQQPRPAQSDIFLGRGAGPELWFVASTMC